MSTTLTKVQVFVEFGSVRNYPQNRELYDFLHPLFTMPRRVKPVGGSGPTIGLKARTISQAQDSSFGFIQVCHPFGIKRPNICTKFRSYVEKGVQRLKIQVAQLWQRDRASSINDFRGGQFEAKS